MFVPLCFPHKGSSSAAISQKHLCSPDSCGVDWTATAARLRGCKAEGAHGQTLQVGQTSRASGDVREPRALGAEDNRTTLPTLHPGCRTTGIDASGDEWKGGQVAHYVRPRFKILEIFCL